MHRPGVYEIAVGTPVGDLLRQAGGPTEAPQAILAGGYFGGWIRYSDALDIPVSDPALRAAGASLGPGIVVLVPASACGLAETARVVGYLAGQSAGQCGPCLNGLPALAVSLDWTALGATVLATSTLLMRLRLPALADAFWQLAFGRADRATHGWASQLLTLVARRGACHLPDGTAALAGSALRVFGDELYQHAAAGPCRRVRRPGVLPVPGYPGGRA